MARVWLFLLLVVSLWETQPSFSNEDDSIRKLLHSANQSITDSKKIVTYLDIINEHFAEDRSPSETNPRVPYRSEVRHLLAAVLLYYRDSADPNRKTVIDRLPRFYSSFEIHDENAELLQIFLENPFSNVFEQEAQLIDGWAGPLIRLALTPDSNHPDMNLLDAVADRLDHYFSLAIGTSENEKRAIYSLRHFNWYRNQIPVPIALPFLERCKYRLDQFEDQESVIDTLLLIANHIAKNAKTYGDRRMVVSFLRQIPDTEPGTHGLIFPRSKIIEILKKLGEPGYLYLTQIFKRYVASSSSHLVGLNDLAEAHYKLFDNLSAENSNQEQDLSLFESYQKYLKQLSFSSGLSSKFQKEILKARKGKTTRRYRNSSPARMYPDPIESSQRKSDWKKLNKLTLPNEYSNRLADAFTILGLLDIHPEKTDQDQLVIAIRRLGQVYDDFDQREQILDIFSATLKSDADINLEPEDFLPLIDPPPEPKGRQKHLRTLSDIYTEGFLALLESAFKKNTRFGGLLFGILSNDVGDIALLDAQLGYRATQLLEQFVERFTALHRKGLDSHDKQEEQYLIEITVGLEDSITILVPGLKPDSLPAITQARNQLMSKLICRWTDPEYALGLENERRQVQIDQILTTDLFSSEKMMSDFFYQYCIEYL